MNSTPRAVLYRFLLGSELNDSFTFAEFKNFFPSKYASPEREEEIRKLHTLHNTKRQATRSVVKKAIKKKVQEVDKQINRRNRRREDNPIYGHSLKECNDFLEKLVKAKQDELDKLKDQIENHKKQLNAFTKELDAVDLEHVSDSSEYTKNIEKVVKALS